MKKILTYILIFVILFGAVFPVLDFAGVTNGSSVVYAAESATHNLECDFFWGEGTWANCIAIATETVFYKSSAIILQLSGQLFNSLLSFSLNKDVIGAGFVADTWGSLRDMANLLFIFVLVAVSIGIILGFSNYNNKRIIIDVITIALLINFSLFAARVVIDTGNIMGLAFYDAIQSAEESAVLGGNLGDVPTKDISGNLLSSFNPAELINNSSFDAWQRDTAGSSVSLIIMFLIGTAINLYIAYVFFVAGFIFIIRIAWLWILMIVSPLAFISYAIPTFRNNWNLWWSKLFDKTFCLLVFMFFMWLTLTIVGSQFFTDFFLVDNTNFNFLELLTLQLLQFMLVITLLKMTLSKTESMCDDGGLGKKVSGLAKGAATLAVGAATGGAAFAARGLVGAKAGKWASSMKESKFATTGSGKLALKTLRNIENAKWGTKEGYKDRVKRQATEHATYAKSLSKDVEIKDSDGNVTQVVNRQEQYLDKMRNTSPLRVITQSRGGAQKYVEDTETKKENQIKRDEKQKELEVIKDKIANEKEKLKEKRKSNKYNISNEEDRKELDKLVIEREEVERNLKDIKEKINPPK